MDLNVGMELATLNRMPVSELRERYAAVFGEPTNAHHKQWLVKRIIWRMQALAEGDLSERARRRAVELANDADLRRKAPKQTSTTSGPTPRTIQSPSSGQRVPLAGSIITRIYKGQSIEVKVLVKGFEFEGETYKSLSAVAKKITGSHCNGLHFFRLTKQGGCK